MSQKLLKILYSGPAGLLARAASRRIFSLAAGFFCDLRVSRLFIGPFVKSNAIDMDECEDASFTCFNDFFTRRLKESLRVCDMEPGSLVSPCDGLLTSVQLTGDGLFRVKGHEYSLAGFLRDPEAAARFSGGTVLVFRLRPVDYHRYIHPFSGVKDDDRKIRGIYHSVDPVALRRFPVFDVNARNWCLTGSTEFGEAAVCEVGAMFVGRIVNSNTGCASFERGQEKGMFKFGGSTIVIVFRRGAVALDAAFKESSAHEVAVRRGQRIGNAAGGVTAIDAEN